MNVASIEKLYDRTLALKGSTMTLTQGATTVTFRGYMFDVADSDLTDEIKQGDRKVISKALSVTPRKGDKVVHLSKTYTVQSSDAIAINGTVVRNNLIVRG